MILIYVIIFKRYISKSKSYLKDICVHRSYFHQFISIRLNGFK